jgi:hypothetical protein
MPLYSLCWLLFALFTINIAYLLIGKTANTGSESVLSGDAAITLEAIHGLMIMAVVAIQYRNK